MKLKLSSHLIVNMTNSFVILRLQLGNDEKLFDELWGDVSASALEH